MTEPVVKAPRDAWRNGSLLAGERAIPEECAIALTYNRTTHAVMMATPADLEDFAIGFSLAERIISRADQIEQLDIVPGTYGIELRMTIPPALNVNYTDRRRALAGPTGCGLCGLESLEQAMRPPPRVASDLRVPGSAVRTAIAALSANQRLNLQTRAVHAAGCWQPGEGLLAVREDVGRHNALDKLGGALVRKGLNATRGLILLTSRVSVEMIQKAAVMGAPIVVAVSAPTGLAVRTADAAGITLIAIARDDGFEVFTHKARLALEASEHVA